jgi:4-amino-4-deoxy-L-arabinose transferase-like glycosyltransferase
MRVEQVLRSLVWAAAAAGVLAAFAWPLVVSTDPDDATLRALSRGATVALLLALAAAAVVRARRAPPTS